MKQDRGLKIWKKKDENWELLTELWAGAIDGQTKAVSEIL